MARSAGSRPYGSPTSPLVRSRPACQIADTFDWFDAPPGAPCPNPAPAWYIVVLTNRLAYIVALPFSKRTPCTIPSPKNQCG